MKRKENENDIELDLSFLHDWDEKKIRKASAILLIWGFLLLMIAYLRGYI